MNRLSLAGLSRFKGLAPLLLRLVAGLIFVAHGLPKLQNPAGTAQFFGSLGIPAPELMVWVVILVEVVGGVGLILGLLTRIWGLLQAIDMLVAIALATLPRGLLYAPGSQGTSELELSLLAMALALALMGPGPYSIDCRIGLDPAE